MFQLCDIGAFSTQTRSRGTGIPVVPGYRDSIGSTKWTIGLRRLSVLLTATLLPVGVVGFCALIAGPKNTGVVSVLPPRFSTTGFDTSTQTHSAWPALLISLGWFLAVARAQGPWSDAGRCSLLLGLAVGALLIGPLPEPLDIVLFYAIPIGGVVVLARAALSRRGLVIASLTAAWLFVGLFGWLLVSPPGWLVVLVMPACWPLGATIERTWPVRAATPAPV